MPLAARIAACAPAPIARDPLDPFHPTAPKDFGAYRVSSNSADPADNAPER